MGKSPNFTVDLGANGWKTSISSTPGPMQIVCNPGGSLTTLIEDSVLTEPGHEASRKAIALAVQPQMARGAFTPLFLYPTPVQIPGGFVASLGFSLKPPLVEVSMQLKGEIRNDGFFSFSGGLTLSLALPDAKIEVANSTYVLDSNDGLTVRTHISLLGQSFLMTGNIGGRGASLHAAVNFDVSGSGINANLVIDTNANPKFRFRGELKLFGRTIVNADLKIKNSGVGAQFNMGLSWIGLEVSLTLNLSSSFECAAEGAFFVKIPVVGRIRIAFGTDVRADGWLYASVGIGRAGFNFRSFKFDWTGP
jgi:hypothetical protein